MTDEDNRPLHVFLCHSSGDKPAVRDLFRRLKAESWIDPWLDEIKLYPGQDWNFEIEKAVDDSDAILVCLSNNSITKEGYVQRELRRVLDLADYKPEGTLFIIPVRLEDCEPPRRLRTWQYLDYFPAEHRDNAYERLLFSLRMRAGKLGISTSKPAPTAKVGASPVSEQQSQVVYQPGRLAISEELAAQVKSKPEKDKTIDKVPDRLTLKGMEFCRVPAGPFLMGSDEKKDIFVEDYEKPQHTVDIPYDYWMARFPVTNEQYNSFVQSKSGSHPVPDWKSKQDHPIVEVSWHDAMAYCRWLNAFLKGELLADLVLRLPTEAEWEKAARGTDGRIYPWGNTFDKDKCNTAEGGKGHSTPVGAYSPGGDSPFGCADMSGNVWEWTHSLYKPYPYREDDGRENEEAGDDDRRVLRGGSWDGSRVVAHVSVRVDVRPNGRWDSFGFRVVGVSPPSE